MIDAPEKKYVDFENGEIAAGLAFVREHSEYGHLAPPKKTLKVDWFLLRAIGLEVMRRRTPRCRLALLTGTVVREFVPDTTPRTRELGEAYRDALMYMFRRRKTFKPRSKSGMSESEYPAQDHGQLRMI